jgi:hypothetical protein
MSDEDIRLLTVAQLVLLAVVAAVSLIFFAGAPQA